VVSYRAVVQEATMRAGTTALLCVALLVAAAAPASAHVGLVPGDVAPGTSAEAQIVLAHGCGEDGLVPGSEEEASAIRVVTLEVPERVGITPREVEGWALEVTASDAGHVERARWTSDDDAGVSGAVFLDLEVDAAGMEDGEEVWLPVTQDCVDGVSMAWDHAGVATTTAELPAMLLTVDASAAGATLAEEAGGLPTAVVVAFVLVLGVVAGGGVVALSLRRS
jgi:periplasmic copper chaperone A